MRVFEVADLIREQARVDARYHEFLRVPTLNCGVYVLAAGDEDPQQPHAEDEVYYVLSGRSRFVSDGEETTVQPGTIIFVEAGRPHRFVDIEDDLRILVFFSSASPGG
jgi:quercetin dioxygenase-like cupin family protein